MNWYRVTVKASTIRHGGEAIVRLNIRAISPTDAVNRMGNNPIRVLSPSGMASHAFETWSVKASYKLTNQRRADFIPIHQLNKDGSTPTIVVRSWEWV